MGANWHAGRADARVSELGSSVGGLDPEAAVGRLERDGPNEVPHQAGDGPLRILWRQFAQPLIYVLLGAAAVSGLAGETVDAAVILGVVLLNALIGFAQEFRAGREMAALAAMAGDRSVVVRGGRTREIDARELVPGDVLVIEAGDKVPADARLLRGRGLMADESLLTGESVPVHKEPADDLVAATPLPERENMLHTGTIVTAGSGRALVVATGAGTELARISELVASADRLQTPLTRAIATFGRRVSAVILAVAAVTFLLALAWGYEPLDGFLAAVALAVAAIPEGLPAIVTIALAVGVRRMARRSALVRQLPAVETLGSTTVICTDKTGTLTRGEMAVAELFAGRTVRVTGVGFAPEGDLTDTDGAALTRVPDEISALLEGAILASDARLVEEGGEWRVVGDTTEGALIVAARKAGIEHRELRERHPRRDVLPFAPEHRYMATLHGRPDRQHRRLLLKGAPEVVIGRCTSSAWSDRWDPEAMSAHAEEMAARGMRVLAVADAPGEAGDDRLDHEDVRHGNRLLGLIGSIDPPRPEAVAAVGACRDAGIRVVMITGDHPRTAQAIAAEIGIDHDTVMTGADLDEVSPEGLEDVAEGVSVFARVAPEHKLALVASLQRRGQVVAMTGDGANDAPALTQADVGVAMGRAGTDAARESADIVLRDDNFATIEAAVEEGRRVYDNLVKSIAFILPTSAGQALLVLAAIAVGLSLPLLPVQVLWINLITAVGLALPLAVEAREPGLMNRPPRPPGRSILGRFVIERIVLVAVLMTVAGIVVFEAERAMGAGLEEARASVATTLVLIQAAYLLACRTLRASPWEVGLFTNRWIHVGIGAVIALQVAYVYLPVMNTLFDTAPIGPREWLLALIPALATLVLVEVHRRLYRRARGA